MNSKEKAFERFRSGSKHARPCAECGAKLASDGMIACRTCAWEQTFMIRTALVGGFFIGCVVTALAVLLAGCSRDIPRSPVNVNIACTQYQSSAYSAGCREVATRCPFTTDVDADCVAAFSDIEACDDFALVAVTCETL